MKLWSVLMALILFLVTNTAEASQTYVVRKGDSLYTIAKKFRIDQSKIEEANSLDSVKLRPGDKLKIPTKRTSGGRQISGNEVTESSRSARPVSGTMTSEPSAAQDPPYHTVRKGDTLASIAKKYSLSVKDLKELNDLARTTKLKPGRQLLVKRTGPKTYTIRKGDTLSKIAKKCSVSAEELQDLNELESDDLKPGQKLIIEPWTEQHEMRNYPILSAASLSEDIRTLAESPELDSIGMKERLILFARRMLNIPYRFGGSTFMGIDCSGTFRRSSVSSTYLCRGQPGSSSISANLSAKKNSRSATLFSSAPMPPSLPMWASTSEMIFLSMLHHEVGRFP